MESKESLNVVLYTFGLAFTGIPVEDHCESVRPKRYMLSVAPLASNRLQHRVAYS